MGFPQQQQKQRRNISVDPDVNQYLSEKENASQFVEELVNSYRAYQGNTHEAMEYVEEYREANY